LLYLLKIAVSMFQHVDLVNSRGAHGDVTHVLARLSAE
jgi:hypothetical protein